MDPVTSAAIILGLAPAAKSSADTLGRLFEGLVFPSVSAVGDDWGEGVKGWLERRRDNWVSVIMGSAEMLERAALEPQSVPGRILFPILQHASLEEDDDLRAKWTALLANAASPGPENLVLPAYAEILRQLTPVQAVLIEQFCAGLFRLGPDAEAVLPEIWPDEVLAVVSTSRPDYDLLMSDLARLQLVQAGGPVLSGSTSYTRYQVTHLCVGFLRAVTPPVTLSSPVPPHQENG